MVEPRVEPRLEPVLNPKQEPRLNPHRSTKILFAGGVSGVVSRTATAPIDRIKMLLQVQDSGTALTVRDGIRKMSAEGTLRAYFKGNGTNVIKIAPEVAIKMMSNDQIKRVVAADPHDMTWNERFLSGALAGATGQISIYPLEVVRTRLAVCPAGTYKGIVHAMGSIWRHEGSRGFFRGLTPSVLGILPFAGIDIAMFEMINEHWKKKYGEFHVPPVAHLATGMLSSSVAQFSSYPLALVRTRLQAQGVGGCEVKYSGTLDVLRKTVKLEGVRGLYKGLLPNMLKLAPSSGISWLVFEECKKLLKVD